VLCSLFMLPLYGQDAPGAKGEQKDQKNESESVAPANLADEMKFRDAMEFIRLERNAKALDELNEYLEIFINGSHRDEAFRQIARIHCESFDYLKAVRAYQRLYEEYGTSESGIEGYYNMGLCYRKMGYRDRARRIFEEIIRDHAGLPVANRAGIQLELVKIVSQ
jgi:tetratricopeptide (TPR) repeat protein